MVSPKTAVLGLVLSLACAQSAFATSVAYPGFPLDKIGHTINPLTGEIGKWCAKGEVSFFARPELTARLHFDQSEEELFHHAHGHMSHGVNLGIVGYSGSTEFIKKYSSAATRTSLVYEININHGIFKMKLPEAVDPDVCRNGYVDSVAVGSKLFIAMVAEFSSLEEYRRFKTRTRVSALWGLRKKSQERIKEFKRALEGGYVRVGSLLVGASSPKLDQLGGEKVCTKDNLEICLEAAGNVLELFSNSNEFFHAIHSELGENRYFAQSINIAAISTRFFASAPKN